MSEVGYRNPPISEAVLQIQLTLPENISVEKLLELHVEIDEEYPEKKDRLEITGGFTFTSGKPVETKSSQNHIGYLFWNKDKNKAVQATLNSYAHNILKQYSNWEDFSSESSKYWNIYQSKFSPKSISNLSLRYINKIMLPIEELDIDDYILNMPKIPDVLPQQFNTFFVQIQVPVEENITAVISKTIEIEKDKCIPFLLDILIVRTCQNDESQDIWKTFERLKEIKNNIFESYITDKTRKLFN